MAKRLGVSDADTLLADDVTQAYGRWAPIYDLVFDLPFRPGRKAVTAAAVEAAGEHGRMLVVGVGTGLELGLLPASADITGIDLSREMLKRARDRVRDDKLDQVKGLTVMDAAAMDYEDGGFDVALAPYVMSVVPEPAAVLDEMWRVVRPGGEVILLNHFSADKGLRARVEAAFEGAAKWLGWQPNFPFAAVGDWVANQPDAYVVTRREIRPFRLFTLLRLRKMTADEVASNAG